MCPKCQNKSNMLDTSVLWLLGTNLIIINQSSSFSQPFSLQWITLIKCDLSIFFSNFNNWHREIKIIFSYSTCHNLLRYLSKCVTSQKKKFDTHYCWNFLALCLPEEQCMKYLFKNGNIKSQMDLSHPDYCIGISPLLTETPNHLKFCIGYVNQNILFKKWKIPLK